MTKLNGYDWLQSYIGLQTFSVLCGLLLAGPSSSILLRIIASVPWYPEIMYVMIVSSLAQIVLPLTKFTRLRSWSNNADFFIWGAVVLAFLVNKQIGPVIFTCVTGMLGNLIVLFHLSKLEREAVKA